MEEDGKQSDEGLPEERDKLSEEKPEELGVPDDVREVFTEIAEIVDSEEIPEDEKKKLLTLIFSRHYRGPAPPPWILSGYDRVVPDGAKWLLDYTKDGRKTRRILL